MHHIYTAEDDRLAKSDISWSTSKLRTPSTCAFRVALVYQPLRFKLRQLN